MESDQLPVEENLDPSNHEESCDAIAELENLSASDNENNLKESSNDINDSVLETVIITSESQPEAQLVSKPEKDLENCNLLVTIDQLKQEESELKEELIRLKTSKSKILEEQLDDLQAGIIRLAQADIARLEYQKQELQAAIAILEKRKERIDKEMASTYAGASQDIAVRVQGFKDYLTGSLQDLVATAEKLNLVAPPTKIEPESVVIADKKSTKEPEPLLLSEQTFAEYRQRVDQLLDRYRTLPDYYGPAWKLRRTFEQVHADRVSKWFFEQSGRGAIRTMGTRLQNILVTSAAISILKAIYGEKLRVLVLATSPERLGEWRRGFQDCLGLTREHFGSDKGIALFEDPEPLATKGDRLVKESLMPLVIIDESEELIAVDLLRFPLLIAFGGAAEPKPTAPSTYINRDNQNNRDYTREPTRESPREYNNRDTSRDYPYKERDNASRTYGGGDRDARDTGYNNRGRSNPDSDWDW
ncbi:DUF3086 domain-containing protein [Pseudanabaena biceps]|nr:DUF3086 domain-containing protein [Pseudanabaena biceps]